MEKWVMIVWFSAGFYLPVLAFDSEEKCYAAIEYVEPGVQFTCIRGELEKPRRKTRSR